MQVNWIPIVERKNSLLFQDFLVQGSSREYFRKSIGVDYAYGTNKYVDGRTSMGLTDLNQSSSVMAVEIEEDENYYERFAEMCYRQAKNLIDTSREIGSVADFADKSDVELDALFQEYTEAVFLMIPFLIMANVVEFAFQDRLAAMLKEETRIVDEAETQSYLRKLVIPSRESLVAEEVRDMLEIGSLVQDNPAALTIIQKDNQRAKEVLPDAAPSIWDRILQHVDRFAWMNTIGYLGEPMTVGDVTERLRYLVKRNCAERLRMRKQEEKEARTEFDRIVEELHLSDDFIRLAKTAGEYIYLRIYRMDALLIGHYNVRPLFSEIAHRMNIELDDTLYLTYQEIRDFLSGKKKRPSDDDIAQRRKGYALVMINREVNLYVDDELLALKEEEPALQSDYSMTRVLPGVPASLGEWTGIARIVRDPDDMDKVQEGDVLVAIMTTPDLILAMERSGAIVTDEGGMLCHAAIVSRELGIPCVIGTKVATLTIKDGDRVEVLATETQGKIKILERHLSQ